MAKYHSNRFACKSKKLLWFCVKLENKEAKIEVCDKNEKNILHVGLI